MLLFYVRHGDPIYNPDSLTELGQAQAQALVGRMKICNPSQIYVSSSNRARQTAQPTADALGIEPIILDWANEKYAFADLSILKPEGGRQWLYQNAKMCQILSSDEVRRLDREWYTHPAFAEYDFCAGMKRVQTHTDDWMASLGYRHEGNGYVAQRPNDDRVALFAHQGFGMMFLSCLLDIPYPLMGTRFDLGHSSVTAIEFRGDDYVIPQVLQLSSDSHLFKADIETKYANRILF
jgi:probable phosphoglycerate mutase